jgi:hypothetical protein
MYLNFAISKKKGLINILKIIPISQLKKSKKTINPIPNNNSMSMAQDAVMAIITIMDLNMNIKQPILMLN